MNIFLFGPGLPLLLMAMAVLVLHARVSGWLRRRQAEAAASRTHEPVLYFLLLAPWFLLTDPSLRGLAVLVVGFVLSHLLLVSGGREAYRSGYLSRVLGFCREACLLIMAVHLLLWGWEMLR